MMRLWMAIGAFTLAAALPAAAPAGPPNACGLLTRADVAAAVGAPVADGKLTAGGPMAGPGIDVSGCSYAAGSTELQVSLWRFAPSAQQSLAIYRGLCKQKEQAAGIGDLACWYNASHNELQVLKGSTLLIFELRRRGASDALMAVAKQALGRLE